MSAKKKRMSLQEVVNELERRTGRTPVFVDGQFRDPKTCSKSKDRRCPKCKSVLRLGYGFAGGYGLGGYNYCEKCHKVYDFVEDKE
jgi:hypothetical protein